MGFSLKSVVNSVAAPVKQAVSNVVHQPLKSVAQLATTVYAGGYIAAKDVMDQAGITRLPVVGNVAGFAGNLSNAGYALVSGQKVSPQLQGDILAGAATIGGGIAAYGAINSFGDVLDNDMTGGLVNSFLNKGGYAGSSGATLPQRSPASVVGYDEMPSGGFDMTPLVIGGAIAAVYFLIRRKK